MVPEIDTLIKFGKVALCLNSVVPLLWLKTPPAPKTKFWAIFSVSVVEVNVPPLFTVKFPFKKIWALPPVNVPAACT